MLNTLGGVFEEADVSDAQEILNLQKIAYQSEAEIYDDFSIPPLTQSLQQLCEEFNSSRFFILRHEGRIVASVNVLIDSQVGLIGRLIVSPELQGRGIGSALLDFVELTFSEVGVFELFTGHLSQRNLNLYQRKGYKETRRKKIHDSLTLVFLQKHIP